MNSPETVRTQAGRETQPQKFQRHLLELLKSPADKAGQVSNFLLARKPRFVIIGTGRSGTTYTADYLTKAGLPVSHERYFTSKGPRLRSTLRDWRAVGDSSWCAVPFLPDPDILAIHQIRHPYAVITSFYKIGFFDPAHYEGREAFVDLARQYFRFSEDPLQSCLRWYIEWNERCEAITDKRFQIERFDHHVEDLRRWLSLPQALRKPKEDLNRNIRTPKLDEDSGNLVRRLRDYPEFSDLEVMAQRYCYEL